MVRKIKLGVACFLILAIAVFGFFSGTIFQRGNPLPYVSKMFTLNDNNPYAKVFDNEDIYLARLGQYDELINHIETAYKVTFIEQMGSAFIFNSDEEQIIVSSEIYWRNYQVWVLTSA